MGGKGGVGKSWKNLEVVFEISEDLSIKVSKNGKNGRGGKAGIARGQVGNCTGRGRNCTGGSRSWTGKLGGLWTVFSTERAFCGGFSGKTARKKVLCGEVGGGFCTTARNGRFFGREFRRGFVQTVPVSLQPLALFCEMSSLSAAWPPGSCPASGCSPRGSGRCLRSCGPPERC